MAIYKEKINIDKERISKAITKAETFTSGEIYAVFARESDSYFFIACFVWTFIVYILSICVAFWMHWSWHDIPLHYFGAGMLLAYIIGLFYISILPALRMVLTPTCLKKRICHSNAVKQFLAQNIHRTQSRTAILLFISLEEHYAEVIVDTAISDKVPQDTWNDIVASMTMNAKQDKITDAYLHAIEKAATVLSAYFPPQKHNSNELPDHVVEI